MKNEVLNKIKIKTIWPHDFTTPRFQTNHFVKESGSFPKS